MSKEKKIWWGIGIIVILLCGFVINYIYRQNYHTNNTPPEENYVYNKATLTIDQEKYEGEFIGTISVYDFMDKLQQEGKITFKYKDYPGMGIFIEEINGIKSDTKNYWIYSVNGKEAEIGVSEYKISQGDIVSWKYGEGEY